MSDLPVGHPVPNWTAPPRPDHRPMVGSHVTITPFALASVADLWESFSRDDGSMWTYMGYGPFDDPDQLADTVASWPESSDPLFFTFDVGGHSLGWGSYLRITPDSGSIEVGHLAYSPSLQRTTAATEAMYLMADYVFALGYRRYEWKCDALNQASRRAAQRLGFVFEGVFRNHMIYKGRNRDTAWFSITDEEWPALESRFQAWLDPSNFGPDGRQHRSI
jgi:RimJ/RimL family protein N-acetyltransferase